MLREALRRERVAGRVDQGVLEGALQLADVPRPGVLPQKLHGLRGNVLDVPIQLAIHPPKEVADQQRQVVDMVA